MNFYSEFKKSSKTAWESLLGSEIKDLKWATGEGLTMEPYYFKEDQVPSYGINAINRSSSGILYLFINCDQDVSMDQQLQLANSSGAGALILKNPSKEQIKKLFQIKTDLKYALFLEANHLENIHFEFLKELSDKQKTGGLYIKLPDEPSPEIMTRLLSFHNDLIQPFTISSSLQNKSGMIANMLAEWVELVEMAREEQLDWQKLITRISFQVNLETSVIMNIGVIRTLRFLAHKIASAYQAEDPDIHIHGRSDLWINDQYGPKENILKATTAAISGIVAGIESMSFETEHDLNDRRITNNINLILTYESHLFKNLNPVDGSYYFENLTQQLSHKAWSKFLEIEERGGYYKLLRQQELDFLEL